MLKFYTLSQFDWYAQVFGGIIKPIDTKGFLFEPQKQITHSPYWTTTEKNGVLKKRRNILLETLFRSKHSLESLFGIRVIKEPNKQRRSPELYSRLIDRTILKARDLEIARVIYDFARQLDFEVELPLCQSLVSEYTNFFYSNTKFDHVGGMGFNNGLFLFCITKLSKPEIVIESGVWKGFTTSVLDAATDAAAKLLCFDIDLGNVEYESKKAVYFEADMSAGELSQLEDSTVLAFFDDHVSQLDRLISCYELGYEYLIFDDDVNHFQIHSDGWPAIPTISMLQNKNSLPNEFDWEYAGDKRHAKWTPPSVIAEILQSFKIVTQPDLFELTGYRNSSRTTFLRRNSAHKHKPSASRVSE